LNRKLIKLYKKAEKALSREKAQKVLKKFEKKFVGVSNADAGRKPP
tara:strand:+ start:1647 stop:1784 length:138 start_codon:yes stop_codon:yes gene_type:complete